MRFIHTGDWHVGKTLRGRRRLDEHRQVLGEIVDLVRAEQVDAVLVAGDIYDSASPSSPAQQLVNQTLIALGQTGAEVIVIAGNHDHPETFEAYRPLMRLAGITLAGRVRRRGDGGVHTFTARGTGEQVNVALLPFLPRRYAVKAEQIVSQDPAANSGRYDAAIRQILAELAQGFTPDAVNLVIAHLTCTGGRMGGGEREAQSIFEYHVPATAFPPEAHYVALGHLHRRQQLPAACPVHYCGSPIAVDFGEEQNTPVVCLVEAMVGRPATVSDHRIRSARRLRTVSGTLDEVLVQAPQTAQDWLRVVLREKTRAGLRDQVLAGLPNALEVRIHPDFAGTRARVTSQHRGRTPAQLFGDYLEQQGIADPQLMALFTQIDDELAQGAS